MNINEIVNRISYFRIQANLSARELSLRIGKSETYINHLESKPFNFKINVILDIIAALNITCEKFFSENYRSYDNDIEILNIIKNVPEDRKRTIIDLIKHIK